MENEVCLQSLRFKDIDNAVSQQLKQSEITPKMCRVNDLCYFAAREKKVRKSLKLKLSISCPPPTTVFLVSRQSVSSVLYLPNHIESSQIE